jgi:WD40 repeat protein
VIVGNYTLPFWLSDLAIAPDNQLLAGVDLPAFSLHFLDPASGAVLRSLQWTDTASPALYGAILSPDWTRLAWYARGTIQLMDAASGEMGPSLEHEDFITTIAWSPNSDLIASAAAATSGQEFLPAVTLWDPQTGEQLNVLPLKTSIAQIKFSPDGTQLGILTTDGGFQVWNIQS